MNTKTLGLVVLVVIAFNPSALGHAQRTCSTTRAKMEAEPGHNLIGVSCRIKGSRHAYFCVIDSGATNTVISDQVVKPEGVIVYMDTTNGVVRVPKREVSLTIAGGPELKAQAFVPKKMPEGVQVLIGQDVLRQFCSVVFDYDSREIEFRR
ncbi:MAG: hypothetical protein KGL02_08285 [Acidobacteriota bacterium]|nr:hypothetical protein [Acidobacteriota bacterium]MDE3170966.1 hypothetical protein [Acidobacteriota bacterium]